MEPVQEQLSPPRRHPSRAVLELAELVLTGALPALPAPLEPPGDPDGGRGVVLEDDEGTPVALVTGTAVRALKPFTHGPLRSARRTPSQVRAEGATAVPVAGSLSAAEVARFRSQGPLLWLVLIGDGRRVDLPAPALLRAVREVAGPDGLVVPVAVPAGEPDVVEQVARAYGAGRLLAPGPAEESRLHPAFARQRERVLRPPAARGVTVFLTGLSGSGKSTVARGLAERLDGERTVTLLDGDQVRRLLSAGLGFGRADRDLNIRRIGFVAAEVTRHGGLAICAPIAPFAQTRAAVREAVEEHGDFVLVHVCTPLAECERRDRKGLYARARAGQIPEFTGISSPYEVPVDADLRLDTTRMTVAQAVDSVHDLLFRRGYLGSAPDAPTETPG